MDEQGGGPGPEPSGEPGLPEFRGLSGPAGAAEPSGPGGPPSELSARDRAVLDIAARNWTGPGPRDRAVRERLGMSPTAFFQHLNALLDDPAALRHDPVTVNRWRAARARNEANR